ncbi:hypothetical protein GCM10017707_39890 [Paenarthrobacter aurescens]
MGLATHRVLVVGPGVRAKTWVWGAEWASQRTPFSLWGLVCVPKRGFGAQSGPRNAPRSRCGAWCACQNVGEGRRVGLATHPAAPGTSDCDRPPAINQHPQHPQV